MVYRLLVTSCLTVLLFAGCGDGIVELSVVPVSGVVTVDGTPTENLIITLDPQIKDARPATAVSGPEGKFTLETPSRGNGAAVGSYRVSVSDALPPKNAPVAEQVVSPDGLAVETANEKSGGKPIAVFVPQTRIGARYARFAESTLTIEVPAKGLDSWKLELTAD